MKYIKMIGVGLVLAAGFVGVTGFNRALFDTNYTFDTAIVKWPDGTTKTIRISKWMDYEGEQMQIWGKDGKVYLISTVNAVLIKSNTMGF